MSGVYLLGNIVPFILRNRSQGNSEALLYVKGNCALVIHFFCCGCVHNRKWNDIRRVKTNWPEPEVISN